VKHDVNFQMRVDRVPLNSTNFLPVMMSSVDLPMWPSGLCTRPPCAVESDALSGRGSRLNPGASVYQRIISNNSCAHDEQGVNPGQLSGFDGVLYQLTFADALTSSVKVSSALT